MRLSRIITIAAVLMSVGAHAQELRFRPDGTFKIVQFTDMHTRPGHGDMTKIYDNFHAVMKAEQPDFVVFTGDQVTGRPAKDALELLLCNVEMYGLPYAMVEGNHDWEQGMPMTEFCSMLTAAPNCLNTPNADGIMDDLALTVKSATSDRAAAVLYCLDSHTYSQIEGVDGYGWFSAQQIEWYRKTSASLTEANGGTPLPAMAFYHIAVPEFTQAAQDTLYSGKRLEKECPGPVNPGMFAAMLECGGMMANFIGHDHDNDYITRHLGIDLGYGRFSGWKTTYINLSCPGARVITLTEGSYDYSTHIRLLDGRVISPYTKSKGSLARHEAFDTHRWMQEIPDSRRVCKISIPGTHASVSSLCDEYTKSQNAGLDEQLAMGIRAFDLNFTDFCRKAGIFDKFLQDNTSEMLIISLKSPETIPSAKETKRLTKLYGERLVNGFRPDITLGECRGKMLLLLRDETLSGCPGVMCKGWTDNGESCEVELICGNRKAVANVTDRHTYKKGDVQNKNCLTWRNFALANAESEDSGRWFISFGNAISPGKATPWRFASWLNPALADELQGINSPCGIFFMDFAESSELLINRFVNSNFGRN